MKSTNTQCDPTWAVIVAFFPNADRLDELVRRLLEQVKSVVVYDNGGADNRSLHMPNVHILGSGQNVGIASALNRSIEHAISNGARYIVTFDQDSCPSRVLIRGLRAHLDNFSESNIAAVGPTCFDVRNGHFTWPVFAPAPYGFRRVNPDLKSDPIPSIFLITSGMMFDVERFKQVGPFDDSLFIDHVDTAWGLRANAMNLRLLTCPDVRMKHELSRSAPRRVLGRLVLDYPPIRRYYTARNSIRLALSSFTPLGLRFYFVATTMYRLMVLPMFDATPGACFRAIVKGIGHGVLEGGIAPSCTSLAMESRIQGKGRPDLR
ncbi:MAG: glycosyltransferase family 2 protein [Burkholderiales bacterium]